jgi:hypothetical protein
MENFVNNEKFKNNLENELENINDHKRILFDQIKKLEVKKYYLLKYLIYIERRNIN